MNYVTKTARTGIAGHSIFTHAFGKSRPVYDAPNEGQGGGAPTPPTPPTPPAPEPTPAVSDEVAKLVKENMKKKGELEAAQNALKAWEGLNPDDVRKLVAAQAEAEEKRKADEEAAALARGEFDRVKQSMADAHAAAIEAERTKAAEKDGALAAAHKVIEELTVGASFLNSKFITDNLVLPPTVARKEFGDHFETVNGVTVAYDKPKGSADRTPLVDAQGKNLAFEAAIEKLVNTHPEKDRLLKGKLAPGAKSTTTNDTKITTGGTDGELKGASRIAAALAARRKA